MNEELVYQVSLLQQEAEKINSHLETMEKQILELNQISQSINQLNTSSEKEIISSLGKGIHLKTHLAEKKLFVEVGSGVVVRKTPEEAIKVIESQLKRLMEFKVQLFNQRQLCMQALNEVIAEIQKENAPNQAKQKV
ncbi:MAG: prefoldin subunit alpha [archaeon]|nr:prefoldin subunit alpha [archaeon]